MALERHIVELAVRDQLSPALKKVGQEAERAGKAGEDAGKRGTRGMKDWSGAARTTGLALGTLAGLAIKTANESEQVQVRLKQSVENTGESYEDLTPQIEAMNKAALDFAFDDEDASGALANLTDATGDATTALEDMSLVMDIARARGIDLAGAAKIVAAAEQGRYASLARLGIQIDENATREDALGALQEKYAGQAEAYAETNAASWDKLGNRAENALEGIGAKLTDYQGLLVAGALASQLGVGGLLSTLVGGSGLTAALGAAALAAAPAALAIGGIAIAVHEAEQGTQGLAKDINALGAAFDDLPTPELDEMWNRLAAQTANPMQVSVTVYGGKEVTASLSHYDDLLKKIRGDADLAAQFLSEMAAAGVDVSDRLNADELRIVIPQLELYGEIMKTNAVATGEATAAQMAQASVLAGGTALIDSQADAVDRLNRAEAGQVRDTEAAIDLAPQIEQRNRMIDSLVAEADEATATGRAVEIAERGKQAARQASAESLEAHRDADLAAASLAQHTIAAEVAARSNATRVFLVEENARGEAINAAKAAQLEATQAMVGYATAAGNAATTTSVLDSGVSVIIGGIDRMGSGIATVETALTGLVGAEASLASVTADSAAAQGYMNQILVDQAPLLADLVSSQTDYIAGIADLPADQQLLALAYMDSAKSAQALEMQTLALSAASGELGEGGADFATDIIAGAAQADPVLKAMLVDMGLISVGADGTVTVNVPEGQVSELEALNTTLQELQGSFEVVLNIDLNDDGVIGYVPPELPPARLTVDPSAGDATVSERIAAWGGLSSTSTHNANIEPAAGAVAGGITTWSSMASTSTHYADTSSADNSVAGSVGYADSLSASIDIAANTAPYYYGLPPTGQTIGTNFINVAARRVGIGFTEFAMGGLIDHAAVGGIRSGMTLVGERGPELVSLPGGSLVHNNSASRGIRGSGGGGNGVVINGPVTVVANNPEQFMRQMRDYTSTMVRR